MTLRPITQAQSDAWDAQPGTDVFGHPWSSWQRVIITNEQATQMAEQEGLARIEAAEAERRYQLAQQRLEQRATRNAFVIKPAPQLQLEF